MTIETDTKPRQLADALLAAFDGDGPDHALACSFTALMRAAHLRAWERAEARAKAEGRDPDGDDVCEDARAAAPDPRTILRALSDEWDARYICLIAQEIASEDAT